MITLRQFQLSAALAAFAWAINAAALDEREKEHIRTLSNEAAIDYSQHHYDVALTKFRQAYKDARVPKLAVWCARANLKLGRLLDAFGLYQEALNLKPNELWKGDLQQQAQIDARHELDELTPRIPKITISVKNARSDDVSVTIDEIPVSSERLLEEHLEDPGTHRIVGKLQGVETSETVVLAEGEMKQVVLRFGDGHVNSLAPAGILPSTTSNGGLTSTEVAREHGTHGNPDWTSQRTFGLLGLGVGASAFVLGTTTGLVVAFKYGDLHDKCNQQRVCEPRYQSEIDHYETMRTLSTVSFAVAGVATVTGITLLLTAPKRQQPSFGVRLSAPVTTLWSQF